MGEYTQNRMGGSNNSTNKKEGISKARTGASGFAKTAGKFGDIIDPKTRSGLIGIKNTIKPTAIPVGGPHSPVTIGSTTLGKEVIPFRDPGHTSSAGYRPEISGRRPVSANAMTVAGDLKGSTFINPSEGIKQFSKEALRSGLRKGFGIAGNILNKASAALMVLGATDALKDVFTTSSEGRDEFLRVRAGGDSQDKGVFGAIKGVQDFFESPSESISTGLSDTELDAAIARNEIADPSIATRGQQNLDNIRSDVEARKGAYTNTSTRVPLSETAIPDKPLQNTIEDTNRVFSNAGTVESNSSEANQARASYYSDNRVDNGDGTTTVNIPGKGSFTSKSGNIDSMISRLKDGSKDMNYARSINEDGSRGQAAYLGSDGRTQVQGQAEGLTPKQIAQLPQMRAEIRAAQSQRGGRGGLSKLSRTLDRKIAALNRKGHPSTKDRIRLNRYIKQRMGIEGQNITREKIGSAENIAYGNQASNDRATIQKDNAARRAATAAANQQIFNNQSANRSAQLDENKYINKAVRDIFKNEDGIPVNTPEQQLSLLNMSVINLTSKEDIKRLIANIQKK
ncbi:MAG: hypothetical protein DRN30_03760 [Thermoplasmata archaeon]|nr:MAG: hypothetical protein DRN30_03760 [Thermoplasmata archaeon]